MTHFMAYVILLSAAIAAGALLVELLVRGRAATRWLWVVSLGAIMIVAGVATFAPLPVVRELPISTASSLDLSVSSGPIQEIVFSTSRAESIVRVADAVLPTAWVVASVFLVLAILYGQRRLLRERRSSESRTLDGHEVLLTEISGPAVAGVGKPVVLLPRWVLALDTPSRDLLLAHEFEHVKQGDTRLLLAGAVITALMPWNPVVWWIDRRLRLAVEKDCDARVLRAHPDVRRYADLLLMAAGRPSVSTRLLAAHFGEHRSDLDRRIRAMTERTLRWRPTLAAAVIAGVLLVASCEAPRPEPLAPRDGEKAVPNAAGEGGVYYEFQVEKPVTQAAGSPTPKYPEILRQAGVEGEALVQFVVDEQGAADAETFKVIRSTHELFAAAVKKALPEMRFVAAEVGRKKVKQLVQQPFSFAIVGGAPSTAKSSSVETVSRAPRILLRSEQEVPASTPHVVVHAFDGHELARGVDILQKIDPQSIHSIEVLKGNACAPVTCPLIKVTLAKGKTLGAPAQVRPERQEQSEPAWEPKMPGTDRQRRLDSLMATPMNFEIYSSTGDLIARFGSRAEFRAFNLKSEDINGSIGSRDCKTYSPCPITRHWLKPGREVAYKKS